MLAGHPSRRTVLLRGRRFAACSEGGRGAEVVCDSALKGDRNARVVIECESDTVEERFAPSYANLRPRNEEGRMKERKKWPCGQVQPVGGRTGNKNASVAELPAHVGGLEESPLSGKSSRQRKLPRQLRPATPPTPYEFKRHIKHGKYS